MRIRGAWWIPTALLMPLCLQAGPNFEGKRVLIAKQHSAFKDAVVSNLEKALTADACAVSEIDAKALGKQPLADYDIVVIVNTCHAWHMIRPVQKLVDGADDALKAKLVIVTTAADPGWTAKAEGVDAVTSASKADPAKVAAALVEKVRARLTRE